MDRDVGNVQVRAICTRGFLGAIWLLFDPFEARLLGFLQGETD